MSAMASQITGVSIVNATVCPGADQRKHQSCVSLVFARGIHGLPVNAPHKGPITRKMYPSDDVIINLHEIDPVNWPLILFVNKDLRIRTLLSTLKGTQTHQLCKAMHLQDIVWDWAGSSQVLQFFYGLYRISILLGVDFCHVEIPDSLFHIMNVWIDFVRPLNVWSFLHSMYFALICNFL